jgi:hypothetical protein
MSRDYSTVCKRKDGKYFRRRQPAWNVNVWGVNFWGEFWNKLGLHVETINFSDEVTGSYLPHVISDKDFKAVKERFESISHDELREAVEFALTVIEGEKYEGDYEEMIVELFREEVLPMFQKPNTIAVVSDYVMDLKWELEKL